MYATQSRRQRVPLVFFVMEVLGCVEACACLRGGKGDAGRTRLYILHSPSIYIYGCKHFSYSIRQLCFARIELPLILHLAMALP